MEQNVKQDIVNAMKDYQVANNFNEAQLRKRVGLNENHFTALMKGSFTLSNKQQTVIKDSYFIKIATAIGYEYERVYWKHIDTEQYEEVRTILLEAKQSGLTRTIIGESGSGKTYGLNKFAIDFPIHTYHMKVSSLHRISDIINEFCELLKLPVEGSEVSRLRKISSKLRGIKLSGQKPLLVLDESENLKLPALKMMKALYDAVEGYCPIVLIGTDQLEHKLELLKDRNTEGMPQFYSRFKAGRRQLREIDKSRFDPFFEELGIDDQDLRSLLENVSENYRELNHYLEPALKEAEMMGVELTEEQFRVTNGMV